MQSVVSQTSITAQSSEDMASRTKISIMLELLREDDNVGNEDEIRLLLRTTASADVCIDPLQWLSVNSKRCPTMAKLAKSVQLAQDTSVSSKGINSWAGNLISSYRTSVDDVAIEASPTA